MFLGWGLYFWMTMSSSKGSIPTNAAKCQAWHQPGFQLLAELSWCLNGSTHLSCFVFFFFIPKRTWCWALSVTESSQLKRWKTGNKCSLRNQSHCKIQTYRFQAFLYKGKGWQGSLFTVWKIAQSYWFWLVYCFLHKYSECKSWSQFSEIILWVLLEN